MEKLTVKKTIKKPVTKVVKPLVKEEIAKLKVEETQMPIIQNNDSIQVVPSATTDVVTVEPIEEKKIMPTVTIKPTNTIRNTNGANIPQNSMNTVRQATSFKKPQNFEKDKIAKAMTLRELDEKSLMDLRKIAQNLNVFDCENYNKNDLIIKILEEQTKRGGNIFAEGVLEIINDGSHGVLRSLKMLPGNNDVYVSGSQIKRFNLKPGDYISGQARAPKEGERYLSMLRIEAINNLSPDDALKRPMFTKLTPIFPNKQIKLETEPHILSTRLIDLLAPIGKGQRGMLVSPPKVGKTWLLKEIADGITKNHPEIHLMVVLVGERPEEVTDMERSVKGEVIAANFDEPPELHTKIAEMAIERAKRLVELGGDVVILMDSLTRLARAYNITAPPSGRTLSGGFDPVAIYPPKKFFGAARNFEEGGSLTVIATSLVETGSRMDEVIFEEFKGTGNMELKLDRRLAERRVYPAIDVKSSGTRNEDKLLSPDILNSSWRVRRMLDIFKDDEAKKDQNKQRISCYFTRG
jgi:transcription termination factor Rho